MDMGAILQLAISMKGEQEAKNMSEAQLRMFAQQLADMKGISLPELEKMTPDQLGASAEGSMAPDEGLRSKQLAALGEIQNDIDSGGLDLTDKANVEEALNAAVNQQRRARAGVAGDAAERGQLNSGNRLMMDMNAAQAGANDARKSGLEVAGMAQRRRLQAIQDSANMAAALRNEDWQQKSSAAHAKDLRDERNAAAREKAQYYNAGIPQQQFTNDIARKTGAMPAANAYGGALAANATDTRQSAAGLGAVANQAASGISGAATRSGGGGGRDPYTYNTDPDKLTALSDNPYPTESSEEEWKNPYK
jgi:hypothetical protein